MNDYFLKKYFAPLPFAPDDFNMPFSTISPSSSDDKVCLVSLISLYSALVIKPCSFTYNTALICLSLRPMDFSILHYKYLF